MGCDIHWLLERRTAEAGWVAVMSEHRHLRLLRHGAIHNDPAGRPGARNYPLFGLRSSVRSKPMPEHGPMLAQRIPRDMSGHARLVMAENRYMDRFGWADGIRVAAWAGRSPVLDNWFAALDELLQSEVAALPLPALREIEETWHYEDQMGHESVQELARRRRLATGFLDAGADRAAWRILVGYDN